MKPASAYPTDQLMGKRVVFCDGEEHQACWHHQVGLKMGTVLRSGQSLAQKAELLQAEGLELPESDGEEEVIRIWVKADATPAFPTGCETAVEKECLLVIEPVKP
jgi:hypothetical protein